MYRIHKYYSPAPDGALSLSLHFLYSFLPASVCVLWGEDRLITERGERERERAGWAPCARRVGEEMSLDRDVLKSSGSCDALSPSPSLVFLPTGPSSFEKK